MTRTPSEVLDDCEVSEFPEKPVIRRREPKTRVSVTAPFSVAHEGIPYFPDEIAEVPASVAQHWLSNKWVTKA